MKKFKKSKELKDKEDEHRKKSSSLKTTSKMTEKTPLP